MQQKAIHRLTALLMIILLASPAFLLPGCGNNKAAVDGSKIAVSPASQTATQSASTSYDFTVTVRYADGKPYPKAIVHITGAFAAPRNVTNTNPRYQFYYGPGGENGPDGNPLNAQPVSSGFDAQTDDYGNYTFSITVPGPGNVFTDSININSGSAFASVALTIS